MVLGVFEEELLGSGNAEEDGRVFSGLVARLVRI